MYKVGGKGWGGKGREGKGREGKGRGMSCVCVCEREKGGEGARGREEGGRAEREGR